MATTTVSPEKILKELAALWVEEGKHGGAGVLRACSLTLVVIAEESEDVSALGETIAALMPEHPARAIMVRLRPGSERSLSERVYQQCWRPFGQRQQICCEQIELTASDAALGDVPSVLLPLVVADLPVILWCRSTRLMQMPEFAEFAKMATKVVIDSSAFPDASAVIRRMVEEHRAGLRMADLTWTRLTRWREMLSRLFENREYLARLPEIKTVKVSFGPGFETAARYMAAWTQNSLADAGVKTDLMVIPVTPRLTVELRGEAFVVDLVCEGETLVAMVDGLANRSSLGKLSEAQLMREELAVMRRDMVFERTLASAAQVELSSNSNEH